MNITINIDENMFSEVVEKELKALPKEKIQDIIIQGIGEYLRIDDYKNIKPLIVKNHYGYSDYHDEPSDLLIDIMKRTDTSKLQDVTDKCIDALSNDYEHILIKVLSAILSTGLLSSNNMRDSLDIIIKESIYKYLDERR